MRKAHDERDAPRRRAKWARFARAQPRAPARESAASAKLVKARAPPADTENMRFFNVILAASLGLAFAGCSGAGKFGQGLQAGKKKGDAKEPAKDDKQEPNTEDASADQPVQITGTYLTCAEVDADATRVAYGCRLADKRNGATVDLARLATRWDWGAVLPKQGTYASVQKQQPEHGSAWQIVFDVSGDDQSELRTTAAALRITLDLALKPEAGGAGGRKLFDEPLSQLLAAVELPAENGIQTPETVQPSDMVAQGDQGVVAATNNAAGQNQTTTNNTTTNNTATATNTAVDTGTQTNTTQTDDPPPTATNQTVEAPTVAFQVAPKQTVGGFVLRAALSDVTGVTDLQITGGGKVNLLSASYATDGGVTINWTAPVRVSLKKGGKTCSGSGTVGTQSSSLALTCQ